MSQSIEDLIPNDRRLTDKTAVYGGSGTAFLSALNALDSAILPLNLALPEIRSQVTAAQSEYDRRRNQLTAYESEYDRLRNQITDFLDSRIFSSNKNDWYKPVFNIVSNKFMLYPCEKIQPGQLYSFKKNKKSVKKNKKSAKK